jgi:DDE superfamily endonuclease
VTNRRTKRDYAEQLRYLADPVYPHVEYIRLVQDNLNTHTLAALYEVFPPAEARRLASRFEGHSTPKHGSWLNMAEVEISVVQRGCLARPVGDVTTLRQRMDALERERNAARCTIQWQFTSQQARTTLADLYPVKQTSVDRPGG